MLIRASILLAALASVALSASAKDNIFRLELEHAVGQFSVGSDGAAERTFSPRGELTIELSKKTYQVTASLSSKQFELSPSDVDAFRALIEAGGDYTLRAREKGSDDASPWIVASVPACLLAANKFSQRSFSSTSPSQASSSAWNTFLLKWPIHALQPLIVPSPAALRSVLLSSSVYPTSRVLFRKPRAPRLGHQLLKAWTLKRGQKKRENSRNRLCANIGTLSCPSCSSCL